MPVPSNGSFNNYILVVFDSCRYDSFMAAKPKVMARLGNVEQRWSYASWTSPSHYNLMIGLMPHLSPKNIYASEYYKTQFLQFNERLGCKDIQFLSMLPQMYFPIFLKETLGYSTN
ncbi:MAG: metalloenzyme, partial [Bryobacteraceae bacterium]